MNHSLARWKERNILIPLIGLAVAILFWGFAYIASLGVRVENSNVVLLILALFGLLACVAIFYYPPLGFYFIALWNPLQYFFTAHLRVLPDPAKWLDDAVVMLLVLIAAIRVLSRMKMPKTPILPWLLVFVCLASFSALVNQLPPATVVAGLRPQLMYPLFFLAIVALGFSDKVLMTFLWISTLLALLQVPVSVMQFMEGGIGQFKPDIVFGTFALGWANLLGHYLLIFVFIFIGISVERSIKRRWLYILIVLSLLVGIILTSSRSALVFFGIGLLPLLGRRLLNRRVLIMTATIAVCLVIAVGQYYSNRLGTFGVEFRPQNLLAEQLDNINSPGRLHYLVYTWELIQQDFLRFLLGFGPGSYASTAGAALKAPLLLQATRDAYSPTIQSQVVAVLGEYGVLGTIALWGMYISMFWWLISSSRRMLPAFWQGVSRGMVAVSIHFIFLGVWVEKLWETQPIPYYFWFFAAALFLSKKRQSWP